MDRLVCLVVRHHPSAIIICLLPSDADVHHCCLPLSSQLHLVRLPLAAPILVSPPTPIVYLHHLLSSAIVLARTGPPPPPLPPLNCHVLSSPPPLPSLLHRHHLTAAAIVAFCLQHRHHHSPYLFRIPHLPPAGSLKVLHAPVRQGGIRRASQTKIYNLETDEFVSNPPFSKIYPTFQLAFV